MLRYLVFKQMVIAQAHNTLFTLLFIYFLYSSSCHSYILCVSSGIVFRQNKAKNFVSFHFSFRILYYLFIYITNIMFYYSYHFQSVNIVNQRNQSLVTGLFRIFLYNQTTINTFLRCSMFKIPISLDFHSINISTNVKSLSDKIKNIVKTTRMNDPVQSISQYEFVWFL